MFSGSHKGRISRTGKEASKSEGRDNFNTDGRARGNYDPAPGFFGQHLELQELNLT